MRRVHRQQLRQATRRRFAVLLRLVLQRLHHALELGDTSHVVLQLLALHIQLGRLGLQLGPQLQHELVLCLVLPLLLAVLSSLRDRPLPEKQAWRALFDYYIFGPAKRPLPQLKISVDDEGSAPGRNVLIEDGILKGYIQDTLNARLMKMPVTGNARRESYAALPMPRMTNTYMLNGDKDPQEIIASVKNGLYAVNFGGGQVDIVSGKFVFSCTEAYWIDHVLTSTGLMSGLWSTM